MSYPSLLDENIESEVLHRLEHYGYDVVHIDFAPELGKGTADTSVAEFSKKADRVILTCDDDFVRELDADVFRAVLYFDDVSLSPAKIADIIHRLSEHYPQDELRSVESIGREWLQVISTCG